MKTISIRDLRQRWPEAEALLAKEGELIVTRDSKPVAKLTRFDPPQPKRKRFDPKEQAAWRARFWGKDTVHRLVDKYLDADRNDA